LAQQLRKRGFGAEVGRAGELELAHRNAADDLREVFADADQGDVPLDLAEPAAGGEPLVPVDELGDRLDVGGGPGKAVDGALVGVDARAAHLAALAHDGEHRGTGGCEVVAGGGHRRDQGGALGVAGVVAGTGAGTLGLGIHAQSFALATMPRSISAPSSWSAMPGPLARTSAVCWPRRGAAPTSTRGEAE